MLKKPMGLLGIFLIVVGFGYFVGAGVAYSKVQGGYNSLQAFSEAQNVELSYNDDGQLVDRGEVEGGQAILTLLEDDWDFPVVRVRSRSQRSARQHRHRVHVPDGDDLPSHLGRRPDRDAERR